MVLLDFSVTPLGKGESVSSCVARCLEIVAASDLDYRQRLGQPAPVLLWDSGLALFHPLVRLLQQWLGLGVFLLPQQGVPPAPLRRTWRSASPCCDAPCRTVASASGP